MSALGETEMRQATVEDAVGVVDFAVSDEVDGGHDCAFPASGTAAAALAAAGRALMIRSRISSVWA